MSKRTTIFQLHPYGWENSPEEERFKIPTSDYLIICGYNHYALFFRLTDDEKPIAVEILKDGISRTIAQVRHYIGRIEKDPEGGHSFVNRKDDTVHFEVQWLDGPDSDAPSINEIEEGNFGALTLGDVKRWSVPPMTYGEKPEAHPDNSPKVSSFKANFVRGGLVLILHNHHYANDIMGWAGMTHQLAENCYAIAKKTGKFPPWDQACLDLSRLTKPEPPEDQKVDGPPVPQRHPDQQKGVSLLFHLPKSKAARLKELAKPEDGTWVSTYDAMCAFMWRHMSCLRAPVFKPDLSAPLFWVEAVDMRRRFHDPPVPPRMQQCVMGAGNSAQAGVPEPSAAEIISEWPFWKVARHIRQVTDSVSQEALDLTLSMVATVKDKGALNMRIDSFPPMSMLLTDHRNVNITAADFGFARPITYRHLIDVVSVGIIVIYPPRDSSPESDEGVEIAVFYEKALAEDLINDKQFGEFFEYRGVDAEDVEENSNQLYKSSSYLCWLENLFIY